MSQIPFPGGAADQDVFFHEDKVCVYRKAINTWECRTINTGGAEAGQPAAVTTQTVYTIPIPTTNGSVNDNTKVIGDLRTQYDVNWFIAEKVEELFKGVAFLEQQVSGLSNIFVGELEPNNDYNQWTFWYNPVSHEFLYWDAEQGIWIEVKTNRPPIFSDTEPTEHPDFQPPENELIAGDVWIDITDPDDLIQYIYNGTDWVKTGGDYVHRKGGDSMQGPLKVTGQRSPNADGIESTVETLNVDSGQNSSLHLKFDGQTKVYVGSNDVSFIPDIKFNNSGSSIYTGTTKKGLTINTNGVFYEGDYVADKHLATKKNVEEAIYHDILDTDTNKYVDRAGDSMTGELKFSGIDNGKNIIQANRGSGEYPVLLDLTNNNSVPSTLGGYDIKIGGSTVYNELRFTGQDTYLSINGGGGSQTPVKFHRDVDCGNNRFRKLGRAIEDDDAVPYGQIEEELQEFRDQLISDLTFGTWQYASGSSSPVVGRCFFRNALNQNSGISPSQVTQMIFNEVDFTGAVGAFDRIDVGEIISLTNGNATVKYKINSAAATSGSQNDVRSFEVLYLSQTSPIVFIDGVSWTFTLTEFTDISVDQLDDTYLRLDCSNDPLETELHIKTPDFGEAALSLIGKRDNTNNAVATVAFKNQFDTSEQYAGYLTYRTTGTSNDGFFRFNRDVDLSGNGIDNLSFARFNDNGAIFHNSTERIKFKTRSTAGAGDGLVEFLRPGSNSRRGITIRGRGTDNTETDLLYTYTNSTDGDAINYLGRMTGPTNIVTKKYVDDAVASGGSGLPSGGENGMVLKKSRSNGSPTWQGAIDINSSGSGRAIGEMWYNPFDGTLYLRVS
jgi:hypothetical protein